MRAWFFISWIWYCILLLTEIINIQVPTLFSSWFLASYYINWGSMAIVPMGIMYIMQKRLNKVDHEYLFALCIGIFLRTIFYVGQVVFDFDDKNILLAISGVFMLIYFIFDIRRKIDKI